VFNWYIVPKIGTGVKGDGFRPKYIDGTIASNTWTATDLGMESLMVVWADTTPEEDAAIDAQTDAARIPPLDNQIGGALTKVSNVLEAANLPANWITATNTFREVLRACLWMTQLMQRLQGQGIRIFGGGVTLSSTFGSLPANVRSALIEAATFFHLDTSAVTGSTTLRAILRGAMVQFSAMAFTLGDNVVTV
jgi:hypothetical protein